MTVLFCVQYYALNVVCGAMCVTWCLKGTQDKKKVPFKCLTFPKSSRRAGSEYVKFELFRWDPSEKIYVLYVAMAEKALSSGRKLRKIARIATSRKRNFRSPKRKSENTFQYKLPPKTWGKSPQKPLSATRKCFFGHCDV